MIVCHCNLITTEEIEDTIRSFLDDDPWQLIVPLQVYHAMEKRGKCCGCFPNVINIIVRVVTDYHETQMTPEAEIISFIDRIKEKHESCVTAERLMRQRRVSAA